MNIKIALLVFLLSLTLFDIIAWILLWLMNVPVDVVLPILNTTINFNDIIYVILVLFPLSILEVFFILHFVNREKMWSH